MSAKRQRKQTRDPVAAEPSATSPGLPRWVPPVLYSVLALLLFRAFVFSHQMLFGSDTLSLGYVARAFYADQLKAGTFPRWAPRILGGTPFLEALSGGDALYPTSLLLVVMEPFRALGWKLVLHILVAGLFMYGWLRTIGASKAAALLSGTAYMLAPFLVSLVHPGHDGKIFVTSLTPLMFWVVERFFARPRVGTFSGVALVVALVLFTTHFQMAYFLFGAVGVYAFFRAVQLWRGTDPGAGEGTGRGLRVGGVRFALFLVAAVVGLGGAAVQFVPAAQYVTEYSRRTQTTRQQAGQVGVEWSSSWALHPEEAMGLVIPEFAGNDAGGSAWSSNTYWGRNAFKDNAEYGGILVLILAAVSFAGAKQRGLRWFFTGLGAVALLFALGTTTPVWHLFYTLVPGIRLFRAPSTVIFLFGFAAITLAGLGLDRIFETARGEDAAAWRRVHLVLWGAGGVLFVLALLAASGALTSFWTSVVYKDIDPSRLQRLQTLEPFITRGAWIAAIMALFVAGLSWALRARYLAPAGLLALLLVLVVADEMRVDATFIQTIDFQRWSAPDPTIQAILNREQGDDQPYRLLSLVDNGQDDKPTLYGIDLAAGHHPNDLARYRELIGMVGSGMPQNLLQSAKIRHLLNVRYILWPDYQQGPGPQGNVITRTQYRGQPFETLYGDAGLPRARLLAKAVVKPDDEQVPYMLSDAFQPDSEVVLGQSPPVTLDGGVVKGSVTWQERTPNELKLSVTSDRAALLVIADNWFPAWHATVDGAETPVLRAYHTLRAVPVPAGTHTVDMVYHSSIVARSLWVSVVVLLLLFGGVGWGWVRERGGAGA